MIFINLVQATVGPSGKNLQNQSVQKSRWSLLQCGEKSLVQAFLNSTLVSVAHCVLDSRAICSSQCTE